MANRFQTRIDYVDISAYGINKKNELNLDERPYLNFETKETNDEEIDDL